MYMVISKWEAVPGHEAEFRANGRVMRNALKRLPEIELLESFAAGAGQIFVVMGYKDEAAYQALVQDPHGRFAKLASEHGLEDHGRWIWSERGQAEVD